MVFNVVDPCKPLHADSYFYNIQTNSEGILQILIDSFRWSVERCGSDQNKYNLNPLLRDKFSTKRDRW